MTELHTASFQSRRRSVTFEVCAAGVSKDKSDKRSATLLDGLCECEFEYRQTARGMPQLKLEPGLEKIHLEQIVI